MPNALQFTEESQPRRSLVAPTLFSALPDDARERLLAGTRVHKFATGQLVSLRSEQAEGFWLIETGGVRVGQHSDDGDFVVFAELGVGDSYGELAVLSARPRVVDAIALQETSLRWISASSYEGVIASDKVSARALLGAVAHQLQEMLDRVAKRETLPAQMRIAQILSHLAPQDGTELTITQQELAELAGTSRMTVTTALSSLERSGFICRGYGKITVIEKAALLMGGETT